MTAPLGVDEVVSALPATSLEDVIAVATLQTRVDRKYLVPLDLFAVVLEQLTGDLCALQIRGRRVFRYESVYFDTPDLAAYRQHAHGRRRRVKIRTRAYLDSDDCLLEFKSVGARGETIKERYPYPFSSRHELDTCARELAQDRLGQCISTSELGQVLTTAYQRATLVDLARGTRVTCDVGLEFQNGAGQTFGPLGGGVVIESKTAGSESPIDHALRRLGWRPLSLSKYCVGMAVLDPRLPANRWNRELRTHFGWTPQRR